MSEALKVVDEIQHNVGNLFHLLEVVSRILLEMPFERDGKRNTDLDRVVALTNIARDLADNTYEYIENNHVVLMRGP